MISPQQKGLRQTPERTNNHVIKFKKSPKSGFKVGLHTSHFIQPSRVGPPPELSSLENSQVNDNMDITRAWANLKISSLSRAIAIAPQVGPCSLGPNSSFKLTVDSECHGSPIPEDTIDCDKPDLSGAITSTPLKPHKHNDRPKVVVTKFATEITKNDNNYPNDDFVSQISSNPDELSQLETLKVSCLRRIDEQVMKRVQKKREQRLRLFREHDDKVKEELVAYKIELDKENLLREQQQYIASQNEIIETKINTCSQENHQERNKIDHDKRIAETEVKIKQIEQKRKELEEKQKQKREELKHCIDGIYKVQIIYNQKYNQITELSKSCRDSRMLYDKASSEVLKLRATTDLLLKIVDKCKGSKVTLQDLQTAEALVQQIAAISEVFSRHVDEINKSYEKAEEEEKNKRLIEQDIKTKHDEIEKQQNNKETSDRIEKEKSRKPQSSEKWLAGVEDCISGDCLKWHLELSQFLEDYENKLQPLLIEDSLKKFRFDCQKVVNVPVNAISPLDDLHLQDKLYKLTRLLQCKPVPNGNSMFLVTGHPLGLAYCTNTLAKKFVKQGEHAVSSKPESAFAIAAVIVALWAEYPDFGRLLLAHFHNECPYLIPAFMPQVEGQSNENYYRMLGYQYSEDGKVESQDKFLRRMSGVMRLYSAILVTPLRRSQVAEGRTHPHSMREAWRWLTASLNLGPRPDISPTLIFDFLEVAGDMMFKTYGSQFTKLLHLLCADYFPLIEKVTPDGCGGPVVRLKSFLEKILKEGRVPPPAGILPPNFW